MKAPGRAPPASCAAAMGMIVSEPAGADTALFKRGFAARLLRDREGLGHPSKLSTVYATEACQLSQVRNQNRFEELRALGADEIIDVTEEDVVARVKAITSVLTMWIAASCWCAVRSYFQKGQASKTVTTRKGRAMEGLHSAHYDPIPWQMRRKPSYFVLMRT